MNFSYWEHKTYFENVNVAIIGSGIVGLFTALEIKKKHPDYKIIIVERGVLPDGASTKNAGFACFGSISELLEDLNHFSLNESLQLVQLRVDGLRKLREELGDENIGFNPCGGIELFTEKDDKILNNCLENIEKYNDLLNEIVGKKVYQLDNKLIQVNGISSNVKGAIFNQYEGSINTGKALNNLIKKVILNDIIIVNNIQIKAVYSHDNDVTLETENFSFQAKQVVVATNGFATGLISDLDVKPARAQVLVTSQIPELKLNGTFHHNCGYNYFRNIDNRVLLGGGRNLDLKSETTTDKETTPLIMDYLENLLREVIIPGKNFQIDYRWSGVMGVGAIKKPIVRKVQKNVFVAVRMGGMGVAIGSKIGEMAAQLIDD